MAPAVTRNWDMNTSGTNVRDVAVRIFGNAVDQLLLHITICIERHITFVHRLTYADCPRRARLVASLLRTAARHRVTVVSLYGNCALEVAPDGRKKLVKLIGKYLVKLPNAILLATAGMLIGRVGMRIAGPHVAEDDLHGHLRIGLPPRGLAQRTRAKEAEVSSLIIAMMSTLSNLLKKLDTPRT